MSLVVLVLVLSLVVRAEYSDYAGVNMPQYSMEEGIQDATPPSEDYLERSPDSEAPIPSDYKYEEDLRDKENKLPMKYDDDDLQEHEEVTVPKVKISRKIRRYRTRDEDKELDEEQENYRPRISSKDRSRKIYKDDIDIRKRYNIDNDDTREESSIKSDDINYREKDKKVIRRKPRDKSIHFRRLNTDGEGVDEDLKSSETGDVKHLERDNKDSFVGKQEREYERRKISRRVVNPPRHIPEKINRRKNDYPVYGDDYYDMKRVKDMKNRPPDLLRRTQATKETPLLRPVQDISYRRANIPDRITVTTMSTTNSTTQAVHTNSYNTTVQSNSTELSLAEKSRLSILKKAQKKNEIKNIGLTTKPPVLMQVTKQMHTLVMVEPAASLGAREEFNDSPGRIVKAKQLMRRKLVAGARNIHELTDNWDEMVCDYIDESLLDSCSMVYPPLRLLFIGSVISLCWSNCILI